MGSSFPTKQARLVIVQSLISQDPRVSELDSPNWEFLNDVALGANPRITSQTLPANNRVATRRKVPSRNPFTIRKERGQTHSRRTQPRNQRTQLFIPLSIRRPRRRTRPTRSSPIRLRLRKRELRKSISRTCCRVA